MHGDFVFSEEEYHRQYAEPFRWSNLVETSSSWFAPLVAPTGFLSGFPWRTQIFDVSWIPRIDSIHTAAITRFFADSDRSPPRGEASKM